MIIILIILFFNIKAAREVDWQEVEKSAQNTVVQVWAQKAEFNWLEPYKAPEQMQVSGSAFFINASGDLLTNFHVIDQAKSIFINIGIFGRRFFEVVPIGVCPESDIALLKLTPESLDMVKTLLVNIPFLPLGNSDILYPTQPVLALGYPLGQRYLKSTVGVIAGREYLDGNSFMHITAPINPGNSGGPLLTTSGEVIGINSAGIPNAQNIGYIVPINDVKIMLEDLYKVKLYRKAYLGLNFNHATDTHSKSLNNPVPGGVYINFVQKNSVADKAGIKVGDMLYGINCSAGNYKIDQYGDVTVNWRSSDKISVSELLIRLHLGEDLELTIYRNGEEKVLPCKFELSSLYPIRYIFPDYEKDAVDYEMFGGLVIMQLRENHFKLLHQTPLLKQYTRLDYQDREVLVITRILPGSQMHKVVCFYPGMLIDKINGVKVKNLSQLREALMLSKKSREISVMSKENVSTVVSLDKILQEEPRLSNDFIFPITKTLQNLMHN